MAKSKIEWCDAVWNPITGCSKCSLGCRNCWAERMARRLAGRFGYPEAPNHFDVTLHPDRLDQPLHWKKPRRIFVVSMGDLFHENVPTEFIAQVFSVMLAAPQHAFQVLTKRPRWMQTILSGIQFPYDVCRFGHLDWPLPNVWLGVTVENQKCADERRVSFKAVHAAVKFVSYEPALGPVDWTGWEFIDQLIFGGESGPGARPAHPQWFRDARDWCLANDIAPFFKQWGEWAPLNQLSPEVRRYYCLSEADDQGLLRPDVPTLLFPNGKIVKCVGKQRAGRLLDGREWNQMPES